jgi:hypothetical protein
MVEHILTINGPDAANGKPKPLAAGNVLRAIDPAVRATVAMGFRGSSSIRGRMPRWLSAASDIRFVELSGGQDESTLLHFEAPRFGDVADEVYSQETLFDIRPNRNDTAFNLFADVLSDIANRNKESERFDTGILRRLESFKRPVFGKGVETLTVSGDRIAEESPARLDSHIVQLAESLHQETPAPSRARITGKLDMIRASDRVFVMILKNGEKVRGVWDKGDVDELGHLFGQTVVVDGSAIFRPSGQLLLVRAEIMTTASDQDSVFSALPKPTSKKLDHGKLRKRQTKKSGMAAIFDKWPSGESENEILAALDEIE